MMKHLINRLNHIPSADTVGERGQVLMLFAGGLIVFLGLVGLSVDVGQLVQARTDLQKTADAAAFAGAQGLSDAAAATLIADEYVTLNRDAGTAREIEIFSTNTTNDTITVTATDTVNYIFLGLLGNNSGSVSASATVRVDVVTGYTFDGNNVLPYTVWGGARNSVDRTAAACDFNICVGSRQVFRSNDYQRDSDAAAPDWDVNGTNFMGYFHAGGDVYEVNPDSWQTVSRGGNAVGQQDLNALMAHVGPNAAPIILPVVAQARCTNGCDEVEFRVVAWVALQLDEDFSTNPARPWSGTVVANYAASYGSTSGTTQPTTEFVTRTYTFVS